jgi:hypothetical protein
MKAYSRGCVEARHCLDDQPRQAIKAAREEYRVGLTLAYVRRSVEIIPCGFGPSVFDFVGIAAKIPCVPITDIFPATGSRSRRVQAVRIPPRPSLRKLPVWISARLGTRDSRLLPEI